MSQPDRSIERLLAQAMPHRIVDPAEHIELARRAQAGDEEARNRLLIGNIGLVVRILAPYLSAARSVGLEAADLLTVGLYGPDGDSRSGFARAIERYDPSRGTRLSTYAQFWVRYAIDVALRRAGVVRVPDARPRAQRPQAERVTLEDAEMHEALEAAGAAVDGDAEAQLDASRLDARLRAAIVALPARESYVIRRRFSRHEPELSEIAAEMGLSRQRVQQLEAEGLRLLRAEIGDRDA